jgi:hypothetical protein
MVEKLVDVDACKRTGFEIGKAVLLAKLLTLLL